MAHSRVKTWGGKKENVAKAQDSGGIPGQVQGHPPRAGWLPRVFTIRVTSTRDVFMCTGIDYTKVVSCEHFQHLSDKFLYILHSK